MCKNQRDAESAMRVREGSRAELVKKRARQRSVVLGPGAGRHLPRRIWQISFSSQPAPLTSELAQATYLFCLLRHGCVTIVRQRLKMAAPNSLQRMERSHYSPPWANTSIIGVAGSSGSGKTSLALAIIKQMSLPWVVILSMVRLSGP